MLGIVVVYDNINFKSTKRNETVGDSNKMLNFTTTLLIEVPFIEAIGGLK
jgi:hypothetical protein